MAVETRIEIWDRQAGVSINSSTGGGSGPGASSIKQSRSAYPAENQKMVVPPKGPTPHEFGINSQGEEDGRDDSQDPY